MLPFTSLRHDFKKCTQLVDFSKVTEEDILAIRSQLDFVESTAFLNNEDKDLKFAMELAFNVRTKFYLEHFVASHAKHEGFPNTENYLRIITLPPNLKRVEEKASSIERDMLSEFELENKGTKKTPPLYIFRKVKMTLSNHTQLELLVKKFYRAHLSKTIMDEARDLIDETISHPHEGKMQPITITKKLVDSIPMTAQALFISRKLEFDAFSSCIGFKQSKKNVDHHSRELEYAQMLADILADLYTDPTQIINDIEALLAKELQDRSKVKYLKYKIKYLNLKKQLNL
jgi:hypothetical protein